MKCDRWQVWAIMFGASLSMSACVVDTPSLESLTCTGDAMTPEARCVDGRWVARAGGSLPADMGDLGPRADMPSDMPEPVDMVDMSDLPDPVDMPDLGGPCSDDRIASLCGDVQCGQLEALTTACPDKVCPSRCQATQQCIDNMCVQCLELGAPATLAMTEDKTLCQQAVDTVVINAGTSQSIACGAGAPPAAGICGLERTLDCQGVCPASMECGQAGVCCMPDTQVKVLCDQLSVSEACGFDQVSQQIWDCETGTRIPLSVKCAGACPLDYLDPFLGAPTNGASPNNMPDVIESHATYPLVEDGLKADEIELWLRPSDIYFTPAAGTWTAVTGADMNDRVNARLLNDTSMSLATDNDPSLRRADKGMMDVDVNFNPYVDLNGGFVEFDRPANFNGNVSIFMVMRNKAGDEADIDTNEFWYQRPAVLSGEHTGGDDFGLTLDNGKLEWSRDSSDEPAATSPNAYDAGAWHVVFVDRKNDGSPDSASIYVDGQFQDNGPMAQGSFSNPIVRMGRHPAPWSDQGQWHGDIAEVILYSRALSDKERRRVQTYLAIKYGVSLRDSYRGVDDGELYSFFNDGKHRVFGLMCDERDYAIAQHSSRSLDGFWMLHAGSNYIGLGACPTTSFSVIMGDDDSGVDNEGKLTVARDTVDYTLSGETYSLEVLERTWSVRIDSSDTIVPAFTMTLDKENLTASDFVPDALLFEDEDGKQVLIPLNRVNTQYDAVVLARFADTGLNIFEPLTMRIARFER